MASLLKIIAVTLAGIIAGLFATLIALDPGSRDVKIGPWRGAPRNDGTPNIDPYGLAVVERSGLLPPGATEGARFVASIDSNGAPLSASCDYSVTGPMPVTRYWSLSVLSPAGVPFANPAARYGLTSAEVLRDLNQPAAVTISDHARPGNWLPVPAGTPFVLMVSFYDPSLSLNGPAFDLGVMPRIENAGCH